MGTVEAGAERWREQRGMLRVCVLGRGGGGEGGKGVTEGGLREGGNLNVTLALFLRA